MDGGRPVLVVEIAAPSTRVYDLGIKLDMYYQVGVQKYVIVDRGPQGDDPVRLLGCQRGPGGWLPLPPDAQGRLDLAPVGLLLGTAEDRPWLYDAVTGARESDRTEWRHVLAETEARAALEERLRALEVELRRQRGEVYGARS